MKRIATVGASLVLSTLPALPGAAAPGHTQTVGTEPQGQVSGPFGNPMRFTETGGEAIFNSICAGCHMPGGVGAVGAGAYPALAKDPKLEAAGYPIAIVLHGQRAMPGLGDYFTDQQVADIVNYVRTHFGNDYTDKVTPEDVKASR